MRDTAARFDKIRLVFAVLAMLFLLVPMGRADADAGERLIEAIRDGDTGLVAGLLSDGVSPDSRYGKDSAMTWAAVEGDIQALSLLYAHGARLDPDAALAAAVEGRLRVLERLLALGIDLEASDPYGMTLLMTAALHGQEEVVALLVGHGASVTVREVVFGYTPLMLAAAHGHPGIVRMLIDHGADVNARTDTNESALHWASSRWEQGPGYREVAQVLRENGAEL